jgi:hypothetical protein
MRYYVEERPLHELTALLNLHYCSMPTFYSIVLRKYARVAFARLHDDNLAGLSTHTLCLLVAGTSNPQALVEVLFHELLILVRIQGAVMAFKPCAGHHARLWFRRATRCHT